MSAPRLRAARLGSIATALLAIAMFAGPAHAYQFYDIASPSQSGKDCGTQFANEDQGQVQFGANGQTWTDDLNLTDLCSDSFGVDHYFAGVTTVYFQSSHYAFTGGFGSSIGTNLSYLRSNHVEYVRPWVCSLDGDVDRNCAYGPKETNPN